MNIIDTKDALNLLFADGQGLAYAKLKSLYEAYADMEVVIDGGGKAHACSEEINRNCDVLEFRMADRKDGGPLLAWSYVYVPVEGRIYSNPPFHLVGHHAVGGFGEVPEAGWRDNMAASGLDVSLLDKVQDYLDRHPPVFYAERAM